MNKTPVDSNKELMDAYFRLYDATSVIKDKELKKLVNILISPKSLSNKSQIVRLSVNLRAERILDHFNLDSESYASLLDIVPAHFFITNNSGVGYRFLMHPRLNEGIYQELIKKASQEEGRLQDLLELTEQCIHSVMRELGYTPDYTPSLTKDQSGKIITDSEYRHILMVLQDGLMKINNII
jgi:hypothetical protein